MCVCVCVSERERVYFPLQTPRPEATGEGGEGGEGGREEVSLMDLGEEQNEDFDPLTRTESVGSKSNSLAQSLSLGNTNSDSPSTGDGAVMDQLSGLDLTIRSQTHTMAPGMQNGTGFLHQPLTLDHSLLPMSSVSSTTSGPSPSPASIVSGVAMNSSSRPAGVVMGGASQIPSQVTYVPAPVPYGMQPVQRMGQKVSNLTEICVCSITHSMSPSLHCRVCQCTQQHQVSPSCT